MRNMFIQRTIQIGIIALSASLLAGCVTVPSQVEVADKVRRTETKFDILGSVTGPEVFELVQRGILADHLRWRVQASTVPGSDAVGGYRLVASVWHQDRTWRNYRTASFVGGLSTPAARVDSKPSCMGGGGLVTCSFTEVVSVSIPANVWASAKSDGAEIRLNANSGPHIVVRIPPAYANGFDEGAKKR
jgi:hypothetical protein